MIWIHFLHAIDEIIHQPSLLNRHGEVFYMFFHDIRIRECSAKPCACEFLLLTDWHPMDVTVDPFPSEGHTVLRVEPHTHGNRSTAQWACR